MFIFIFILIFIFIFIFIFQIFSVFIACLVSSLSSRERYQHMPSQCVVDYKIVIARELSFAIVSSSMVEPMAAL